MRVMQKILLAPRGKVHKGILPFGSYIARIAMWEGSPVAYVWMDLEAVQQQTVEFLVVAVGDVVQDDAFFPVNSFEHSGLWFGLVKYGPAIE